MHRRQNPLESKSQYSSPVLVEVTVYAVYDAYNA
jgi:hypothetical protein